MNNYERAAVMCAIENPGFASELRKNIHLLQKDEDRRIVMSIIEIMESGLHVDLSTLGNHDKDLVNYIAETMDLSKEGYSEANRTFYLHELQKSYSDRQAENFPKIADYYLKNLDREAAITEIETAVMAIKQGKPANHTLKNKFQITQIGAVPITVPDFIIENYIEADTLIGLVGPSGSYKSFDAVLTWLFCCFRGSI